MVRLVAVILLVAFSQAWAAGCATGTSCWADLTGTGTGAKDGSNSSNLCAGASDADCLAGAGDTVYMCGTGTTLSLPSRSGDATGDIHYEFETCGGVIDGAASTSSSGIQLSAIDYITVSGGTMRNAAGVTTGTPVGFRIQNGSSFITIRDWIISNTGYDQAGKTPFDIYLHVSATGGNSEDIDVNNITHDGEADHCFKVFYQTQGETSIVDGVRYADSHCPGSQDQTGFIITYTDNSDMLAGRRTLGMDIDGVYFSNTEAGAINPRGARGTGADQSYIRNNTLVNIGNPTATLTNAIQTHFNTDLIIEYNTIDGVLGSDPGDGAGIIVDWDETSNDYLSDGLIIRGNFCKNTVKADDGKCISVWKGTDTQIYGNVATDCSIGIKVSNAESTGTVIYNNSIADCDVPYALGSGSAPATTVRNNIFVSRGVNAVEVHSTATTPTLSHNIYYGNSGTTIDKNGTPIAVDADSSEVDPQWIGGPEPSAPHEFKLKSGSPARRDGVAVGALVDYRGCVHGKPVPNIGAFEVCSGDMATTRTAR